MESQVEDKEVRGKGLRGFTPRLIILQVQLRAQGLGSQREILMVRDYLWDCLLCSNKILSSEVAGHSNQGLSI